MVAQPRRMSVAEFMALPNDGNRHELVTGFSVPLNLVFPS